MCEAAERNGVQLLCGQTYSMSRDIQAMRRVVALGRARPADRDQLLALHRLAAQAARRRGTRRVARRRRRLTATRRTSSIRCGCSAAARCAACARSVGRWMPERPCPGNFTAYLEFEDGTPATIVYNGYGYFDTSELTWGIGNRMYSDEERLAVRRALRRGEIDNEAPKKGCGSAPARRATAAAAAAKQRAPPARARTSAGSGSPSRAASAATCASRPMGSTSTATTAGARSR